MSTELATTQEPKQSSLVAKFADRYFIQPEKLLTTLKSTAFKQQNGEVSNEQMVALLVVADQYNLNPFTKEIYAFPDKHNGIVPVVGVDGWSRIINDHPALDGIEFNYSEGTRTINGSKEAHDWVECVIYRKDRNRPTVLREYLDEVFRPLGPWKSHTKRMHRHKALIQCARVAFGFSGIYDQDEAERIAERDITTEAELVSNHPGDAGVDDMMPASKSAPKTAPEEKVVEGELVDDAPAQNPQNTQNTPADDKPAAAGMVRIIKAKMDQAGIGEQELLAETGVDINAMLASQFKPAQTYLMSLTA